MHYSIENFSKTQDDNKVIDQIIKWNSEHYRLNLDADSVSIKKFKLQENESVPTTIDHVPHIGNLYKDQKVAKLTAFHILSSRDQIQGGEFAFKGWTDPTRKDNFGHVIETSNPYPVYLNEQGTLFCIPSLETYRSHMIVSGTLEFVKYTFYGENYK
jgi:hypothetical protein